MKYRAADLEQIFSEHLTAVTRALASLGADYMLIGGLAVGVWAEPRATKDCDLSVRVLVSPDVLLQTLSKAGFEVLRGDLARAQAKGEAVRLQRTGKPDEPVVVDLLFATTEFEIHALGRPQRLQVLGVDVPVAVAEDLFVFKLIAGRPQDLVDARKLYAIHAASLDLLQVRRWCRDFGVEMRLDELVAER